MLYNIIPFEYGETFTVVMYFVPALISLVALWFINKKRICIAIPITIIVDLITFWDVLTYYESRPLALVFLIPQVIIVAAISLIIMRIYKKKIIVSK